MNRPSVTCNGLAAAGLLALVTVAAGVAWACVPLRSFVALQPRASGPAGTQVTVVGLGFDANVPVEIRWNDIVGPQLASASGPDFRAAVTIPPAPEGLYSVIVVSRGQDGVLGSAATATFLVTGPGGSDGSSGPPGAAPATAAGSTSSSASPTPFLIWAVVVLLIAGAAGAVWWHRRRVRTRSQPG